MFVWFWPSISEREIYGEPSGFKQPSQPIARAWYADILKETQEPLYSPTLIKKAGEDSRVLDDTPP
jgi:hypothetical protein